jgi:hypothetical protein
MDSLYKELFPFEVEYVRKGRKELLKEAFSEAEKDDINCFI